MKDKPSIDARYANHFAIGFNSEEVVLDFSQSYPDRSDAVAHTRIVTTPSYARSYARLLLKSLDEYEHLYGPISSDSQLDER